MSRPSGRSRKTTDAVGRAAPSSRRAQEGRHDPTPSEAAVGISVAVPLRLELLEEAWFEEPEGPEDDRDDPADPIRHRLRGHSPGSPPWRKARIGVDGATGDRASGEKEDHARRQDHEPTYLHVGSLDGRGLVRSLAEHPAN